VAGCPKSSERREVIMKSNAGIITIATVDDTVAVKAPNRVIAGAAL
jgi:phosphatidate phosphatase APP1